MPIHPARELDNKQLELVAERFLKLLIKKNPELQPTIENQKEELLKIMVKMLREHKPNLQARDLNDEKFLKEVMHVFQHAVGLHGQTFSPGKDFIKQIQALFKSKNLNDKLEPKELKNKFTDKEKQLITELLKKSMADLVENKDKTKLFSPSPKPKPGKKDLAEELTEELLSFANLHSINKFGMRVFSDFANGDGIGRVVMAGIASSEATSFQSRKTNAFDNDAPSINNLLKTQLLTSAGNQFLDEFKKDLQTQDLAPSTAPRPIPGGK